MYYNTGMTLKGQMQNIGLRHDLRPDVWFVLLNTAHMVTYEKEA